MDLLLFVFLVCLCHIVLSVYCSLKVTCSLCSLVCVFVCFVTSPYGVVVDCIDSYTLPSSLL